MFGWYLEGSKMADRMERTPSSVSSESPQVPTTPMGKRIRRLCVRLCRFLSWRGSNRSIRPRRILNGEVEEDDDFKYASAHCLSSYYSVFVARLAIMVMLAILIGLLTVLTWHFTRVYTTKSINSLAYGLRFELLQRPILRMWNILNSTVEITLAQVKLSEYVIRRYDKPTSQAAQTELYEAMRDVTWALFASRQALNAITINYRNGFVQAFHRDHKNNNTFYIYSKPVYSSVTGNNTSVTGDNTSVTGNNTTDSLTLNEGWNNQSLHGNHSSIWYREPLDPVTGKTVGKPKAITPDDLINIAGLSEVADGAASWHVKVSKFIDSPLLSAALPVRDAPNGSIVAVVGVTTALYSVGQLMRELVEFHSGYMYLTSREGYVLSTSTNTPLLQNLTGVPNLMRAVDSEDRTIRLGAKWLERSYGNKLFPSHEVHAEDVKLGHQLYYIDSFFLNLKRLPMVGVIIIPRKYVMGKVDQRALETLIILISASVCILVIGCVCILILTSGVSKEMKLRAELISHLDARRRAEASSNYKSQFLANMSHELRTPMAAVIGLLDILICDDCLTNEQYATVTQIRRCSTALLRLLNNILDLSKVESGKLVLEEAEFDLGRELEGLVDMFSVQCINHNVETVLDLSDDMPKLVLGDSARVVQIFANLISNSIKFTPSGHIILRGWCESSKTASNSMKFLVDQKETRSASKCKSKQHANHDTRTVKKDNIIVLWFEVEDTGCGIDPIKWESVFESFEQADTSTTRTHGGTGLGLCIVRTLVNKMGGEIKVVKKDGAGTLMQLCLKFSTPVDSTPQVGQIELTNQSITVLLALNGIVNRSIMSKWLRENRVSTWEASEWNELTHILREVFQGSNLIPNSGFKIESTTSESTKKYQLDIQNLKTSTFVIVIDIGVLDLSTDIWKEQLKFLDRYHKKAKFAWILSHDTCNAVKMELRRKGHLLMVNKPLYKGKMIQILESIITERNLELQKKGSNLSRSSTTQGDVHECLEIDSIHYDAVSSDDSDTPDRGDSESRHDESHAGETPFERTISSPHPKGVQSRSVELSQFCASVNNLKPQYPQYVRPNYLNTEASLKNLSNRRKLSASTGIDCESSVRAEGPFFSSSPNEQDTVGSVKVVPGKKSLEGLCILLAEDTPVLQKVATIMLEKMGATVVAVGDGLQAVEALKCMLSAEERKRQELTSQNGETRTQAPFWEFPPFDLILMDCQMPKMDGYEATKAIRKFELGTSFHIPIVALTAHAMSSDEAKCLEVGMDAYLTKPIDCKLMMSTILLLTRRMS